MADPRDPAKVQHSLDDIIRLPIMMIAAGYEDGNDAAGLRHDPGFKIALERGPETGAALCSQPTISRMENLPDTRALIAMSAEMVRFYCHAFPRAPGRIVLDIDDTFDAVHGHRVNCRALRPPSRSEAAPLQNLFPCCPVPVKTPPCHRACRGQPQGAGHALHRHQSRGWPRQASL